MSRYSKAIAAFIGAVATWGIAAGADGHYDQVELWGLLGVVGATLLTYAAPRNTDDTTAAGGPPQP